MNSHSLRETVLDLWENIRGALRYGPWYQRLIIMGLPLLLTLLVLWLRPLPVEIKEKLAYWDESSNALFPDGAARMFATYYKFEDKDGKVTTQTRERWKIILEDRYQKARKRRKVVRQDSKVVDFRWTGLWKLEQTVDVNYRTLKQNKVLKENLVRMHITWSKEDLGWFVTRFELEGRVQPEEP